MARAVRPASADKPLAAPKCPAGSILFSSRPQQRRLVMRKNLDSHFIDFVPGAGDELDNDFSSMETGMLLRSIFALAGVVAIWSPAAAAETIKIGVTPGPHAQILEAVKPIAAKSGLELQLIEFSDYVVPNAALDAGDIQANSFQNQPYLDNQKADRGYKIEQVGLTVNFPIGVYSRKHKSWADVPDGAKVSIPNDPTNGGRALLLLRDKGAIKLKSDVGFKPTVIDITDNPRKLKFVEVDAASGAPGARRCRCGGHQHQLCDAGRSRSGQGSDPARGSERAIRQSDCGSLRRQGQAVGQDPGR
ncbi:YaeC family lipoprotein [Bradyrhizobium elkanii]